MQRADQYIGFAPLADKSVIVESLLNDPPDIRWRVVRDLFQIKKRRDREELIDALQPHLLASEDFRVKYRLNLALQALHHPLTTTDYVIARGRGALYPTEVPAGTDDGCPAQAPPGFLPVVDFHIHPKTPDIKFLGDMRAAGVSHGVILATDTDPTDPDRPGIRQKLKAAYAAASQAARMPFESLLKHIKASLYSPTHVTNKDVADWVNDYPQTLIGFGSVNLSKDRDYVERTLTEITRLKLAGIKFLPHAQFFNPATNDHMGMVFDYCRQSGAIILSHSGCGPGPFEIVELSRNSRPNRWESWARKYPDVPIVFAHFGAYSQEIPGIWLFEVLEMGKKYSNIYADLAAVEWLLDREIVVQEIRKTIGFDRILFASDYPLPLKAGVSWIYLVSALRANMHLTQKEKRKVLGGNAARLLGLG